LDYVARLLHNSQDPAFRDYITKDPGVARAIGHWTRKSPVPAEEAAKFQDSRCNNGDIYIYIYIYIVGVMPNRCDVILLRAGLL
jgi:hypothetical protein